MCSSWQDEWEAQQFDDYQNESQAAYALSIAERKPDDTPRINAAVDAGFNVLVLEVTEYCPRTDAILPGVRRCLIMADKDRNAIYRKYNECQDDTGGDFEYTILPPEKSSIFTFGAVLSKIGAALKPKPKQEDVPF